MEGFTFSTHITDSYSFLDDYCRELTTAPTTANSNRESLVSECKLLNINLRSLKNTSFKLLIKYDTRVLFSNQSNVVSLTDFLNLEKQRVGLNGPLSSWHYLHGKAGVPQGYIIRPLTCH